jgi:hypothetical protein
MKDIRFFKELINKKKVPYLAMNLFHCQMLYLLGYLCVIDGDKEEITIICRKEQEEEKERTGEIEEVT